MNIFKRAFSPRPDKRIYIQIRSKFYLCLLFSLLWTLFCLYLAGRWIDDLARLCGYWPAFVVILAVAIIPGFIYMFVAISLLFDRRPALKPLSSYPPLSVLLPAYNEEDKIQMTLEYIVNNGYPGQLEILVIDDGSSDGTAAKAMAMSGVTVLAGTHEGKSAALNRGLAAAGHRLIVTVDADTLLRQGALKNIVERLHADPPSTAAVAGAVLVRNSRQNLMTRVQEWDYFHGIASIKRMQSLFQGILVVQGAFSLYRKEALTSVGGWRKSIGEDIVLTWELLAKGYRTGFAENAVAFTQVPETYNGFFRQRKRWACGMIEGFRYNPRILVTLRFSTLFILWNLLFPLIDVAYLFVFLPGVVLAFFGYYFIAGPMTLLVLPLAVLVNALMFSIQRGMFKTQDLRVRKNIDGFIVYILLYQFLLSPASVAGYISEMLPSRSSWGTK